MAFDLSKLSDKDLVALSQGNVQGLSDDGLKILAGQEPEFNLSHAANQVWQGVKGTAALGADIVAGVPKMLMQGGEAIGAKLYGAATGQNQDLASLYEAAWEDVNKMIPSAGQALGVEETAPYKAGMYPFQKLGEGLGYLAEKAGEATGSKDVQGAARIGLDIGTLGVGIPGAKAVSRGLGRAVEKLSPTLRNITPESVRAERGYGREEPTVVDPDYEAALKAKQPTTQYTGQGELFTAEDLIDPQKAQYLNQGKTVLDENGIPYNPSRSADLAREEAAGAAQGDLFYNRTPFTRDEMIQRQVQQEAMPYEGPGFAETPAKSRPAEQATIDFPLRQEVLESPEIKSAIDNFRTEAARLEQIADNAINPKVRDKAKADLAELQDEFGRGMELLGVRRPSDAYGRGLYEARGAETTGQVVHGFRPKSQRGSFDPEVFREGFSKIKDLVERGLKLKATGQGESLKVEVMDSQGNRVGGALFEPTNKYDSPSEVDIASTATGVGEKFRKQGIAKEIYKFASELGNDVVPSKVRTKVGQQLWEGLEKQGVAQRTPAGQLKIGRKQRGSVGVPPKTFEGYLSDLRKKYGEVDVDAARTAWEVKQAKEKTSLEPEQKPSLSKLPWWESKLNQGFLPAESIQGAIDNLKGFERDIPDSMMLRNLASGGTVQAVLANNPVARIGVQVVNGLKKQANRLTEEALNNKNTGIVALQKRIVNIAGEKVFNKDLLGYIRESLDDGYSHEYSKLTQPFFDNLKKSYDETLTRANEARTKAGLKPIKAINNYFSLMREGKFGFVVKDANGRVISFVRERNMKAAERAYEWYNANNTDGWIIEKPQYNEALTRSPFAKTAGQSHLTMEDIVSLLGENDPMVQKALNTYDRYLLKEAETTMGAHQRAKFRSGVEGAKGTKGWESEEFNAKEAMESIETYFRQMNDNTAALEAAQYIKNIVDDTSIKTPNAKQLIQSYYDNAFNRIESINNAFNGLSKSLEKKLGYDAGYAMEGIRAGKNVLMSLTLGFFNARFLATQIMQPLQVMPPMLSYLSSKGAGGSGLKSSFLGFGDAVAMATDYAREKLGKKPVYQDKIQQEVINYAIDNHIIDPHILEVGREYKSPAMAKLSEVTGVLANSSIKGAEIFTRLWAFSTFSRFLRDSGMPMELALKTAENLTEFTMTSYELHNKPQIYTHLGMLGELASTLQTYKHNELSQVAFYTQEAVSGNAKPFVTQQAIKLYLAGALGYYGMQELDALFGQLKQFGKANGVESIADMDTPSEWLLKNSPDFISFGGLSAMTGMDWSSSFSSRISPESPGEALFPLASKAGNIAKQGTEFVANPTEEQGAAFLREALPSSMTGPVENYMLSEKTPEGNYAYRNPNTKETQIVRSRVEAMMRGMGMRSLRETRETKEYLSVKQSTKDDSEMRAKTLDRLKANAVEYIDKQKNGKSVGELRDRNKVLVQRYLKYGGTQDSLESAITDHLIARGYTSRLQRELPTGDYNVAKARKYNEMKALHGNSE